MTYGLGIQQMVHWHGHHLERLAVPHSRVQQVLWVLPKLGLTQLHSGAEIYRQQQQSQANQLYRGDGVVHFSEGALTTRELDRQGVLHVALLPEPLIDMPLRQLPRLLHQDAWIKELRCAAHGISANLLLAHLREG